MNIEQARKLVESLTEDQRKVLAVAHDRYMYFTGVYADQPDVAQIQQDRVEFPHLLKYGDDGRPERSDKRCAEFMATVTGMPRDWCMAFDKVDFCETHSGDFGEEPKALAWQLDYRQQIKPDVWESVCHVVYEQPEGHYASCATPITSQRELETLLKRPGVTSFRRH